MTSELSTQALIPVAIAASRAGNQEAAKSAISALLETAPGYSKDPLAELMALGLSKDVATILLENLTAAGLKSGS
ncbi:MAG: hypothetical protein HC855_15935 [Rhizobiales bacterium]|nr:hypothetical protein [Hyphomicrobiales bacterium]